MVETSAYIESNEKPVQSLVLPSTEVLQKLKAQTIIIRHAPTVYNEQGLLQGSTNLSITDKGRNFVIQIAQDLINKSILPAIIFTSPLKRARETSQIISDIYPQTLPIIVLPSLREYSFGEFEKQKISDLKTNSVYENWLRDPVNYQLETKRPLKAEPFFNFIQRVGDSLTSIATKLESSNNDALIITHATVIRAVRFIFNLTEKNGPAVSINEIKTEGPNFFYNKSGQFIKIPHGPIFLTQSNL